jgi:hypothetical protein
VNGRARFCGECLPPAAEIGRKEWDRRYRALRRKATDATAVAGGHVAEFARSMAALELGPEHGALIKYAEGLARQLDDRPTIQVGREYRLALALLLDSPSVDEETREEMAERAEFMRMVSTPTRG